MIVASDNNYDEYDVAHDDDGDDDGENEKQS